MRYFSIACCAVLICLSTPTAHAQQQWTLQGCIAYAVENNINIKSNFLEVRRAELSEQQAKMSYIPSVAANGAYGISTGRSLDPTTYNFIENQTVNNINAGVGLNTTLFAGMQKYNQLKKSQLERLAVVQEFERSKNDMSLNVALYFLEILYNKELIVSFEKQIESSKVQIEKMQRLANAGSATKGDVLDLEAQMANEVYSLVDAQNRLAISKVNLCQLLELKNPDNFDIVMPEIGNLGDIFPAESIDQIYSIAQMLPQIEAAKLRAGAAERDVRMAKGKLYPTLSFNASYSSAYADTRRKPSLLKDANGNPILDDKNNTQVTYIAYPFLDQMRDNAGTSFNFSLNIPIFSSLNSRRNVKMAQIALKQSEYTLENERLKLYKDVQQAYTDAFGAMEKYKASKKKLEANNESIKYMEEKFKVGQATIVDYSVAKNNILIAESQMAQAKYDYIFKVKVLEFYKGLPIEL